MILTISAKAQTSIYHPFPDSNAYWRESLTYLDGFMNLHYYEYQYFINGDTTVNSKTYHKIYYTGIKTDWPPYDTVFTINELRFGLREDSNKRIWSKTFDGSSERLLYDFNFNIGEFFLTDISPDSANFITGIDSVLVGNDYRKRYLLYNYWMQSSDHLFIIEGIGASTGLAELIMPPFESGGMIDCFYQNGQVLWSDSLVTNCTLVLGTPEYVENKVPIEFFPNPFYSFATLKINGEFMNAELKIYNQIGELVKKQVIINESTIINRDRLQVGIYFYCLTNSMGNIKTGKFIIE